MGDEAVWPVRVWGHTSVCTTPWMCAANSRSTGVCLTRLLQCCALQGHAASPLGQKHVASGEGSHWSRARVSRQKAICQVVVFTFSPDLWDREQAASVEKKKAKKKGRQIEVMVTFLARGVVNLHLREGLGPSRPCARSNFHCLQVCARGS